MNVISKTTTVVRDFEAERRREGTITHLSRTWFPARAEALEVINRRAEDGTYSATPTLLIEDLKNDLALCGKVISALTPDADSERYFLSPLEDLQNMSVEEIIHLLPKSLASLSPHRFERASTALKSVVNCSITSSLATETFARTAAERGVAVTETNAFSCSLLRQLGLNLLAWNYPSILFRVLKNTPSDRIDQALKSAFGFSPLSLGSELARRWRIEPAMRATLEPLAPYQKHEPLRDVCELGDLFGQKQHKAIFPAAAKEWEERKEYLKHLIGTESTKEIEERVEAVVEQHLMSLFRTEPKTLNASFSVLRPSTPSPAIWSVNPFLKDLPVELHREYESIYENLERADKNVAALKGLTDRAIPASGFARGVICLEEVETETLKPAIPIGLKSGEGRALKSLLITASEARESSIPMMQEEVSAQGRVRRISGAFRANTRRGVLVLELNSSAAADPKRDNVLLFKAARACLERCLE